MSLDVAEGKNRRLPAAQRRSSPIAESTAQKASRGKGNGRL